MNNYPDLTNENNPHLQQPLLINPNHPQGFPSNPPGYNPNYNNPNYNNPAPVYINTNPNPIYAHPPPPVYNNPPTQIHVHHNYNAPKPAEPVQQPKQNVIIVPVQRDDDDVQNFHPNSMPISSVKIRCRYCGNKCFTRVSVSRDNMMIVLIIICILLASLIIPLFFMCSYIQAYIDSEKWEHTCSSCGKFVGQGSKK